MVLKVADRAMKGLYAKKLTPKWEDPNEMDKVKLIGALHSEGSRLY